MKSKRVALSLSVIVLLSMASAFAQVNYSFQTLNYPGDSFTQLLGLNNSGDIAGYHGAAVNKGFTYNASSGFSDENYTGSQQTQVIGINNRPFKTSGFYISKNKTYGFTDFQGTFTKIAYPKTAFNQLLSQNDFGQAAGYYSKKADGAQPWYPYVVDEQGMGMVFELLTLPSSVSAQATGINNAGSVCGFTIDSTGAMHGFLLVQGHYTQLDEPQGTGATAALGLNNNGQVVGSYTDSSGASHGFVYSVSSQTYQSVDDPNGVGTTVVNGINDKGVLVGFSGTPPINNGFIATPSK